MTRTLVVLMMMLLSFKALGQELLREAPEESAASRWANKRIISNRVLDDMENTDHWISFTTAAPEVVDARIAQRVGETGHSVAEISFSREHSREGRSSLRLRMPSRLEVPGPKNGRGWGSAGVRRKFDNEDWGNFNRISLWVHPNCPGVSVVSLELRIYN